MRERIAELRSLSATELASAAMRTIIESFTKNLGTKALALVIAVIVFGVTREEIQRTYNVPIHVSQDPDRVLMSKLPSHVEVELRGPWTELSPLAVEELGYVTVDLREAEPGSLNVDASTLELPHRIELVETRVEPVDLRFDPVIERWVDLVPRIAGNVDEDYLRGRVIVQPEQWRIRGAQADLRDIEQLDLEAVDVTGATSPLDARVGIVRPSEAVQFMGVVDAPSPRVSVRVDVKPLPGELQLAVHVGAAIEEAMPELEPGDVAPIERITVRGPKPLLRGVESLQLPLQPIVTVKRPKHPKREPTQVEVRFEWGADVDAETQAALRIEPAVVRMSIAPLAPVEPELPDLEP